jgi:hypothetical protein
MNQQDSERGLSTADMVAATEHRNGDGQTSRERAGNATRAEETPLLQEAQTSQFRSRWDEIQQGFVDEPRKAVERADGLVAEAIQQLAGVFAEERAKLEQQWDRGDEVSTDDLRVGLQRYRSFFQRLLEV